MHRTKLAFITAFASGAIFLGCTAQQTSKSNAPASPPAGTPVGTPRRHDHAAETAVARIGVAEAEAAVKKGEAILLDVRAASAYKTGHIRGAISLPEAEIAARISTLPRDRKIITYCA